MTHRFADDELAFINKQFYNSNLPYVQSKSHKFGTVKRLLKYGILNKQKKKLILSSDYQKLFDRWMTTQHVISFQNINQEQIIGLFNDDYMIVVRKTPLFINVTTSAYINTEIRGLLIAELDLPVDYRNNKEFEFSLQLNQEEWDTIKNLYSKSQLINYQNDNLPSTKALQQFCDIMIDGKYHVVRLQHLTGDDTNHYLYITHRDNDVYILHKTINQDNICINISISSVFKTILNVL